MNTVITDNSTNNLYRDNISGYLKKVSGFYKPNVSCYAQDGSRLTGQVSPNPKIAVHGGKKKATSELRKLQDNFLRLLNKYIKENGTDIGFVYKDEVAKEQEAENNKLIEISEKRYYGKDILFADYILQWLDIIKIKVDIVTWSHYARAVKKCTAPWFRKRGIKLVDMSKDIINEYYSYLKNRHDYEPNKKSLKNNTIRRRHANIRQCLQQAVIDELIPKNYADFAMKPKEEAYHGKVYYSEKEVQILYQIFANDPLELAVFLVTFFGLRRSELVGLKWSAFNIEQKYCTVKHTVVPINIDGKSVEVEKNKTKNKESTRNYPLEDIFIFMLERLKEQQRRNKAKYGDKYNYDYSDYIFVKENGERMKANYFTDHFKLILGKNKHKIRKARLHDLRHTCAYLLNTKGQGVEKIQKWLGHSSSATTTGIYMDFLGEVESKRESASAMVSIMPNIILKVDKPKKQKKST